uniref:Uncharacterized protein n=1 Tax=Oryza sativa subsp. japonica TaxID=39947 RepID=Q6YYG8_ORYSJ|nr:hypothetical protein [Oryza sativa Japonica Group]
MAVRLATPAGQTGTRPTSSAEVTELGDKELKLDEAAADAELQLDLVIDQPVTAPPPSDPVPPFTAESPPSRRRCRWTTWGGELAGGGGREGG